MGYNRLCLGQIQLGYTILILHIIHTPQKQSLAHIPQCCGICRLGRGSIGTGGFHRFLQVALEHADDVVGVDVHAECRGNGLGILRNHILEIQFRLLLLIKPAVGEHIHLWISLLGFHQFRTRGYLNHLAGQAGGIGNTGREGGSIGTLLCTDNAHNFQRFALCNGFLHMGFVFGHILPNLVFFIVAVQVGYIHQPQIYI